jgi:hypothetical protein
MSARLAVAGNGAEPGSDTAGTAGPTGSRRDAMVLAAVGLMICCAFAVWVWRDWQHALAEAGAELQQVARTNALPMALALRDARGVEEALAAVLTKGQPLTAERMRAELDLRFRHGELADYLPASPAEPAVTTALLPFDAELWREQFTRVTADAQPELGWAYLRAGQWMLPVFYRRADGSHLVVSLPVTRLLGDWVLPDFAGENAVGLRGHDGRILWRQPLKPELLGVDASNTPAARAARAALQRGQRSGYVVAPSTAIDGVVRVIAWVDLPGTDARVSINTARSNVLARWLRHSGATHALMALLLLSGMALVAWSRSRLLAAGRDEARVRREVEHAGELVRQALDAARDTTWQLHRATGELVLDSNIGRLLGLPDAAAGDTRPDTRLSWPWLLEHMDAADRERVRSAVACTCADGAALYEQFRIEGSGAEARHFILKGGLAPGQANRLAVGTLRDVTPLVQSQEQSASALQTLERMCRLARIGPWTVHPGTGLMEMSPVAREILGLPAGSPDELWIESRGVDSAAIDTLMTARDRLLNEGVGYDLVLPVRLPEGGQRWIRTTAIGAHRNAGGEICRIDGALQDVTETVNAQRAIEVQQRRLGELALAVSNSAQLLLVTDTQERITWCNAAFERVSGYALAEILGRKPGPLLQRGTAPAALRAQMRQGIDAAQPVRKVRLQNFGKTGQPYWVDVEILPVFSADGEVQSFLGLQSDVTADIAREQALAQTQARYELATHNARIGIWERDLAARVTRWNDVMFELTGFEQTAGVPDARRFYAKAHDDDLQREVAAVKQAMRDPDASTLPVEFRYVRKPGDVRWLRSECVFERNDEGRATRVVGTLLDVTHERELSQARQARAEAEARSAAKTAFLSRMSHELRTPLNAVIGYAQIVNSAWLDDGQALRDRVQRIETAGWHLLGLIDDILDLARIEGGDTHVARERVALAEVVADAIDLIAPLAEAKGVCIDSGCCDAWVMADAKRLRQALTNLLSNAVKYNADGGRVAVSIQTRGDAARVSVRDTGLGMTPAQLAQLYQPFNRLGQEAGLISGTGIGLTITKALVEQMGGAIDVASESGLGTTFCVTLPLTAPPGPQETEAAGPDASSAPTTRALDVLCVEDNEVNAMVMEESLRLLQPLWQVRTVPSLGAATQAVNAAVPDLILLDQTLPDGVGLDWLAQLACRSRISASKVVMLTADAMPETRQLALAAGVDLFMNKPFDLDELRAVLHRVACTIDERAPHKVAEPARAAASPRDFETH